MGRWSYRLISLRVGISYSTAQFYIEIGTDGRTGERSTPPSRDTHIKAAIQREGDTNILSAFTYLNGISIIVVLPVLIM